MSRLSQAFEEKLVAPKDLAVFKAQSINDVGSGSDDLGQAAISASTDSMKTMYRVDYNEYSNYVFFNSALDYFNISGEKIINEYPRRGSYTDVLNFVSGCDDYQRWLLRNSWVSCVGESDGSKGTVYDSTNKFAPSTGSFTLELDFWRGTSGTPFVEVASKSGSWSVYLSSSGAAPSSSSINFRISGTSGSVTLSYGMNSVEQYSGAPVHMAFVYDSGTHEIKMIHAPNKYMLDIGVNYSGAFDTYPRDVRVLTSTSVSSIGDLSGSGTPFVICSSSGPSISNLSFWSKVRSVDEVRSSYAGDIYKQDNLTALYKFDQLSPSGSNWVIDNAANEGLELLLTSQPSLTFFSGTADSSINYSLPLKMSRSPRPVTWFDSTEVLLDYVKSNQTPAAAYDKQNSNIITNMVPEAYMQLEQEIGTDVLQNFLYIIGRHFDQIKVAIDQFVYWNKFNYSGFNDAPDALLKDAANFYGWDFVGNFLNHDAIKYFFGKGVIDGSDLDKKLYEIKNEFWRRTLNELSHIYKTKGTRESVEALIRVYGMDNKLVKLKEYGVQPNAKITTTRINSHRSLPAYRIRADQNDTITSLPMSGFNGWEVSLHAMFSPWSNTGSLRGTLFSVGPYELRYTGTLGNQTASLYLIDTVLSVTGAVGSVPIMDGHWWNIFASMPAPGGMSSVGFSYPMSLPFSADVAGSSSWIPGIAAQRLDEDVVKDRYILTGTYTSSTLYGTTFSATLGHAREVGGTFYVNEVKLYNDHQLTITEMDAQTLDFQCYGVEDIDDLTGSLRMHWRLDDNFKMVSGAIQRNVFDFSGYGVSGTTSTSLSLSPGTVYSPFKRFLYDYNFITPVEYGWNEDKIRVYASSSIPVGDRFNEANALALEFNLVDALNEDISKMLATMDNWNNVLGIPANKYRDSYPDLNKFRNYYFKKLQGRINFREFYDVLEFFDRSFVKMVQRLLPARAIFYGEEFVVESHMLERPKVQWAYRRYNPELVPEGRITMTDRSGSYNGVVTTTLYYG